MDHNTAITIIEEFYNNGMKVEDEPIYIEALEYLCVVENNDDAMMELGGYYYDNKKFDLALKWYELADKVSNGNNVSSSSCLGYIWYYGRTGTVNYKKAFNYFYRASMQGNISAKLKIADMYKNGYYVDNNYDKYCQIVEELHNLFLSKCVAWHVVPDICSRLGGIRLKQNRLKEASDLYKIAKKYLIDRIRENPFFGNITIMRWIETDLYKCQNFDETDLDIYDAYYLLDKASGLSFQCGGSKYTLEFFTEDAIVIKFNDKWYRTLDDFFNEARIDDLLITNLYYNLTNYEVIYDSH